MNPRPPLPSRPFDHFRHHDSDASRRSSKGISDGPEGSISNFDLYKDRPYQLRPLVNLFISKSSPQYTQQFLYLQQSTILNDLAGKINQKKSRTRQLLFTPLFTLSNTFKSSSTNHEKLQEVRDEG
ncbi:hypothetical protein RchiOBHm_Chr4g0408691 [Rosa chinensis]|uniref:Uncharacterized protein n=1 Tax=Rosa chinensis TaxID=74649 RepID=A0A2P6QUX6_ROSCH|nr:hypothetical protein RchiOBHm_Chr4g0408691 [Rosa chinensis]